MYKVFIENKPIIFHFNSQNSHVLNRAKLWEKVNLYLQSTELEMMVETQSKKEFHDFFADYKYIEAAGGIVQRDATFLFIMRNGVWDIPKGKLEKGEVPEEAAVREIEEECGLIAPIIKEHLIDTWHTYPHKGKMVLKKTYWYWLSEGAKQTELIPQGEEGITAVEYLKEVDFDRVISNTYLSIVDVIKALQKKIG